MKRRDFAAIITGSLFSSCGKMPERVWLTESEAAKFRSASSVELATAISRITDKSLRAECVLLSELITEAQENKDDEYNNSMGLAARRIEKEIYRVQVFFGKEQWKDMGPQTVEVLKRAEEQLELSTQQPVKVHKYYANLASQYCAAAIENAVNGPEKKLESGKGC